MLSQNATNCDNNIEAYLHDIAALHQVPVVPVGGVCVLS